MKNNEIVVEDKEWNSTNA